ncbi:peptidyl-tRNA hydrolase, PTH1 family [Catalinimonas alkaloidigena]|uniref:Peptidyl-tRNA hydrolase n=1 Tax=Catalinimonas alkaloidigena TaxID=1075417 RepID=A0A1G9BCC8_9BACT|nr:aminoacyl-tRNA hydrolase [Catalinimonas alkaloidigena]SDK37147.1 peptidyl-tRNA hydrolase, PTH1 family [Catalinimonas alkaloidigena]
MKYLIACLGNIGPEYELTRHNIGFLVADRLADQQSTTFRSGRHAFTAEFKYKGRTIYLIKPTTYMNLSGKAVNYWLKELKIPVENLLVVTDDLALPFAKLRLKGKGSNGGHNGLGNIQEVLGTTTYARLRFGIGSEFSRGRQIDYVLSNFSKEEMDEILIPIDRACEMILSFCTVGIDRTMNQFNQ